jgi:hypothetical protein
VKVEPGVVAEVIQSDVKENLGALVEVIRPSWRGWWVCRTLTWTRNFKHVPGKPPKRVLLQPGAITRIRHVQLAFKRKMPRA